MKALKALIALIAIIMTACVATAQIPNPGDTNNWITNSPPINYPPTPQLAEHGAIHTTGTDVIEWWNFKGNVFQIEWRQILTDGSWTNIGEGYESFKHNAPEGFYRVIQDPNRGVFPVTNDGTDYMEWFATTDCEWLELVCVNTSNVPPEQTEAQRDAGEEIGDCGYVVFLIDPKPTSGSVGVITVFTTDDGPVLTKQITVIYGEME